MSELLSTLDPRRTAFLTLDIQTALVGFYAKQAADFMRAVTSLLACARNLNATVIHVKVGPAGFSGGQRKEPPLLIFRQESRVRKNAEHRMA